MKYLLGVDFGGGSTKATLLSTEGDIAGTHTVEYPTLHPEPGACEQAPTDWLRALKENIQHLLRETHIEPKDILCVALDAATHTFLLCDETFRPLDNAIHWTDSRSHKQVAELREKYGPMILQKTFHSPDAMWTLPQLIWLSQKQPEQFSKAKYLFFEKDYIRYYLTGVFCTDYIEAQGSMLFDCNKMQWDAELCALAGVSEQMLPKVCKPTDIIGTVTDAAAAEFGLAAGTPVICGSTDTVMEVFAAGAVEAEDMTVKVATAGRICVIADAPHPDPFLVNYAHVVPGCWYPGTGTKSAASSYRWFRDTFGGSYDELNSLAEQVDLGCDGLMFHPYLNGELTPYGDPMLCGSFVGIRTTHHKGHFARAVMEGVALSLLDCKKYLEGLGFTHKSVATLIGGAAKGARWRQILADCLDIELRITENADSSFGAAMLAGVAIGVFADYKDAVKKCVRQVSIIKPNPKNTVRYASQFLVYKQVHDALTKVYHSGEF